MSRILKKVVCSAAALALGASIIPVIAMPSTAYAETRTDRGRTDVSSPAVEKDAAAAIDAGQFTLDSKASVAVPRAGSDLGYVDAEVIVRFKAGVAGTAAATTAYRTVGASKVASFSAVAGLELAQLDKGVSVEAAVKAFEAMPGVEYAQPNYVVQAIAAVPGDTYFADLWGMNNTGQTGGISDADIDAPEAWDFSTGSDSTIIAVLDTGIDYDHPDLVDNLWINEAEYYGDPDVDDDVNGYFDDIYGYDAVNDDGDPWDDHGHGTHCAGTIGASGDNDLGVAGVNWDVSIMAVKVADSGGSIDTASVLNAIAYVDAMGVEICSCSWGGQGWYDAAINDALAGSGALYAFAAGNDGADNDATAYYPAGYDLPNIIAVGASTDDDTAASFSNYGATTVDVFAPGEGIKSTIPFDGFSWIMPGDILWSDNMSSMANWYNEDPTAPWALTSSMYRSASTSLARLNYGNEEYSFVDSMSFVDLSGADEPWLSFWLNCNLEYGCDYVVAGVYDYSEDAWTDVGGWTGSSGSEWVQIAVDLSAWAGQDDIAVWFGVESDESISGAGYYAAVDDVVVTGPPITPDYSEAYATWDGTSMATPHVAGLAALLLSRDPGLTAADLKSCIMSTADVVAGLSGKCATGGRINAAAALASDNTAPTSADDAYAALKNSTLSVSAPGVLSNDSDADGDTIGASLVDEPANGAVTLNSDGSFAYTPDADFVGADTFTYVAYDAALESLQAIVTITVEDGVVIEDKAAGVTFDRFVPSLGAAYSGGSYIYGRWTGTRIESRFTGTKIAWYGPKQPSYGKADVYVDNVKVATVDCYAPAGSATTSAKIWESGTLSAGTHILSIRLVGQKNSASTGNFVVIDKFVVSGTGAGNPQTRANETAGTFSGAWVNCTSTTYTNGTYRYSRWAGAKIRYTFTGTKVAWVGPRALNYGRADVYIDGVKKATVSQYGVLGWRYRVWESSALTAGSHTIEIRVLGTKDAASSNTIVVVDGFDVKP